MNRWLCQQYSAELWSVSVTRKKLEATRHKISATDMKHFLERHSPKLV